MLFDLLQNLRLADIADILFVSIMVYGLLIWLRRTASLTVLAGAPVVAAIYIFAQTFGLYLTTMIFHGFFTVVLIALVILFQDDLRRTLGRRNSWWWLRAKEEPPRNLAEISMLAETLFDLAANRVGALVVLVGREPLDNQTEGGMTLDGRLSSELLLSLFDAHSPGHDGAVIIKDWQVKRFGVHLPLTHNLDRIAGRGTRHSAALGLTERADCLVVVVSEERGSVCAAEDGQIEEIATPSDLIHRIDQYHRQHHPKQATDKPVTRWTRDWTTKFLALGLTCTGWFLLAYQPDWVERSFQVPIEYVNLPEQLSLDGTQPSEVEVTLSGRRNAFSLLDSEELKVSLDLSEAGAGVGRVPLADEDVDSPSGLTVTRVEPPAIRYRLERSASNQ